MIKIQNISKSYLNGDEKSLVIDNASLSIDAGSIISIFGNSGSGKTTLLSIIGTLLKPDSGELFLNDNLVDFNDVFEIRTKFIGFIFQEHLLIPEYTIEENIILPQLILGKTVLEAKKHTLELLDSIELTYLKNRYPSQLSRGERQRISLLRALANKPKVLLCDEPTASLDKKNSELLLDLIVKINKSSDTTFIITTHDESFKNVSTLNYNLEFGKLNLIK